MSDNGLNYIDVVCISPVIFVSRFSKEIQIIVILIFC